MVDCVLFNLLKPLKDTSPPTEVRVPDTRLHVDVPPGWKVVQRVEVPADQTAAIGKRLGGRIEKLSNDVYLVHGSAPNTSGRRRAGLAIRYMPTSSHFRRDIPMPFSGYPVDFAERPPWLVKGRDVCGRNDLERGHPAVPA